MQCKSGYAQAGQNKKRRADARLSWDGVGKLAVGLLLNQNGLDDVNLLAVFEDFLALLIRLFEQCGTFDLNVFCTGDVGEQISAVQLVLNSLLALSGVVRVQIGVAGNSVGELALIQLLDECFIDAGACLSRIDNTGGEEIVETATGEQFCGESPSISAALR